MNATFDRCDVPPVSPASLALPMQAMIAAGRGLVLLRGISEGELRDVEHTVWNRLEGTSSEKVATLLRFRAMVGVFAVARLQQLFLRRGLALLGPAMQVAAEMRLNVQWGFNSTKFLRALEAELGEADQRSAGRRLERSAPSELQAAMA
jgi:hypothetical protein